MTEVLMFREAANEKADDEFDRIIASQFGHSALKAAELAVPFGIELMVPFTPEHERRAMEQADMVTVTTYSVAGKIRDR